MERELVYGEIEDGVVFIPVELARELEALMGPEPVATWDELRARISERRVREVAERLELDEVPADDAALDLEEVPGKADGDWPEWPAQEMLRWMPEAVINRFGSVEDSLFNGRFLRIDATEKDDVVAVLEDAGFTCEEDDALVLAACGYA